MMIPPGWFGLDLIGDGILYGWVRVCIRIWLGCVGLDGKGLVGIVQVWDWISIAQNWNWEGWGMLQDGR